MFHRYHLTEDDGHACICAGRRNPRCQLHGTPLYAPQRDETEWTEIVLLEYTLPVYGGNRMMDSQGD
jgi:hypothetical protein